MCFGGGPDEPDPSAQDRALAAQSVKDQQLFEEVFLPEEIEAIEAADDPEQEALDRMMLRGKSNADINQAGERNRSQARQLAGLTNFGGGQATSEISDASNAVVLAENAGLTGADLEAQSRRDIRRINVANTGKSLRASNLSSLSEGAARGNQRALSKLRADQTVNSAKARAAGELAGAALTFGVSKRGKPGGTNQIRTPEEDPIGATPQRRSPFDIGGGGAYSSHA